MQQQEKSRKPLIIGIIAAVVILAALLALLLTQCVGGQGTGESTPTTTVAADEVPTYELYWNVDRAEYDGKSEAGMSSRMPEDDGYFHVRFFAEGEIITLKVADRKLVNAIDVQNLMGLEFDENGIVIGVLRLDEMPLEKVGWQFYVQSAARTMIKLNSSEGLNGMEVLLEDLDPNRVWDMTGKSGPVGSVSEAIAYDKIMAVQNKAGQVTHVFIFERTNWMMTHTAYCEHCKAEVEWQEWVKTEQIPSVSGHYQLQNDITMKVGQVQPAEDTKICLDLNGYRIDGKSGSRVYAFRNVGINMAIMDTSENQTGVIATHGKHDQGGPIWVTKGALYLYSGTIDASDAKSEKSGVALSISNGAYFYMYGGTVIGGTATYTYNAETGKYGNGLGGTITCAGKMVMNGGEIRDGHAEAAVVYKDGAVDSYQRGYGGNLYISSTGVFEMNGGTIKNGRAGSAGGNLYADGSAEVTINGGSILGGVVYGKSKNGGNLYFGSKTTLTMNGGSIIGGVSYNAAANVYTNGVMVMTGGYIGGGVCYNFSTGKVATTSATTNLFIVNGNVTMWGGTIAGGVALTDTKAGDTTFATIALYGYARITDGPNGIDLNVSNNECKVVVGTLYDGAKIGVNTTKGLFSEITSKDNLDNFYSNIEGAEIVYFEERLGLGRVACVCGESHGETLSEAHNVGCDGKVLFWAPWTSTSSLPTTTGNYFLLKNVTTTKQTSILEADQDIKVDLNGKNITLAVTATAADGFRLYRCDRGSKLAITDTTGDPGTLQTVMPGEDAVYPGKTVKTKAEKDEDGKVIKEAVYYTEEEMRTFWANGNSGMLLWARGGEISVHNGILDGSNLTGAKAGMVAYVGSMSVTDEETGVKTTYYGKLNIYGGTIINGYTKASGNINVSAKCEMNMYGGTIVGGRANDGGNIYIPKNAVFNMYGGTVTEGLVDRSEEKDIDGSQGGNIHIENGGVMNMYGGTVSNGTSVKGGKGGGHGGNICVNGTLNASGGLITGGNASGVGGNIGTVGAGSQINLSGVHVTDGVAGTGGNVAVHIRSNNGLNITNGTVISGGHATSGGSYGGGNVAIRMSSNSNSKAMKVVIEDSVIKDGTAVASGGNLYIYNGTSDKFTTDEKTGEQKQTYYRIDVEVSVKNSVISGGSNDTKNAGGINGGSIYQSSKSTLTMEGCTVTGGNSNNIGGNIYTNGTLMLKNTTVSGGTCKGVSSNSGNIACVNGTLDITDCALEGNIAATATIAGGVNVKLAGKVVIKQGTSTGLKLSDTNPIYIDIDGTLAEGSSIVVDGSGYISTETPEANLAYFSSPVDDVHYLNKRLFIGRAYCLCGASLNGGEHMQYTDKNGGLVGCDGTVYGWAPWNNSTSVPSKMGSSDGFWYLKKDVDMSSGQVQLPGDTQITLDLNGKTVNASNNSRLYALWEAGAALTITDSTAEANGKIVAHSTSVMNDQGFLWSRTGTAITLYRGTIDASERMLKSNLLLKDGTEPNDANNYTNFKNGVAISGAKFVMYGGTVIGGTCYQVGVDAEGNCVSLDEPENVVLWVDGSAGGAISVTNMDMYGGVVRDGVSANVGGNIYVTGTFNLYGGEIRDGSVNANKDLHGDLAYGGNIWANKMYMYGGKIVGGTAYIASGGGNGGNLFISTLFEGYGGTIEDGVASTNGNVGTNISGAVILLDGTDLLNGTANNGGNLGVNVRFNKSLTITENTTISGGNAITGNGGNICVSNGSTGRGATVPITINGEITGGTARGSGGNIYIYNTKQSDTTKQDTLVLTMDGATVTDGTAENGNGGNIYLYRVAEAALTDVTISGGEASGDAGNLYLNNVQGTITGGTISGGEAAKGGNIYASNGVDVIHSNATISGGEAPNGGSIYFNAGSYTLSGTTVTGGNATQCGGNIYINGGTFNVQENSLITLGVVKDETATNTTKGGNIYTVAELNVKDSTVSDGLAYAVYGASNAGKYGMGGNIFSSGNAVTVIENSMITGGSAMSIKNNGTNSGFRPGGNLYVNEYAKVTLDKGTVVSGGQGNTSSLYMSGNSTCLVTVKDATLINSESGCMVAQVERGTLRIEGGTLTQEAAGTVCLMTNDSDNIKTAADGTVTGAEYVGKLEMSSGTINGRVKVCQADTFTLSGGTVDGGIEFSDSTATLKLSGAPTVTEAGGGVNLNGNVMVVEEKLTGGKVYCSGRGYVTGVTESGNEAYFASTKGYGVYYNDSKVFFGKVACLCATPDDHTDGCIAAMQRILGSAYTADSKLPMAPIESVDDIHNPGYWYLPQSITADASHNISMESDSAYVIDLNGNTLTLDKQTTRLYTDRVNVDPGVENSTLIVADSSSNAADKQGKLILSSPKANTNQAALIWLNVGFSNTDKTIQRTNSNNALYILGGTIDGSGYNLTKNNGAIISMSSPTAKAYLYNGEIIGSQTTAPAGTLRGGAVSVEAGTFEMFDGTIRDGVAGSADTNAIWGGNVYVSGASSKFIMHDGLITGGRAVKTASSTATANGHNVLVRASAAFEMLGGQIDGGVSLSTSNVKITGNSVIDKGENDLPYSLNIGSGQTIDVSGLTGRLLVTGLGKIGVNANETIAGLVKSEEEGKTVVLHGTDLHMGLDYCMCGYTKSGTARTAHADWCDKENLTWIALPDTALEASGYNYYVASETQTLSDRGIKNSARVNIDLNGFTLQAEDDMRIFRIYDGATVGFTDTSANDENEGKGKMIGGGHPSQCGTLLIGAESGDVKTITVNIYSGTFTVKEGKQAGSYAGILQAGTNTVINMYGGTIADGVAATNGGNVYVTGNGVFNMYGGTITGGKAGRQGGNVYVNNGTFLLDGGTITDGIAVRDGGNIAAAVHFTMKSGTVSGGKANPDNIDHPTSGNDTSRGGNIYAAKGMTMQGGLVTEGQTFKAATSGGNFGGNIAYAGVLEILGGEVSFGTSGTGGNIGANNANAELVIKNATVKNGTAANGGNIVQNVRCGTAITIGEGAVIDLGTATTGYGGNIALMSRSSQNNGKTMNVVISGTVKNGSAAEAGDDIYLLNPVASTGKTQDTVNVTLSGAVEPAEASDSSIYMEGVNLTMTGGSIADLQVKRTAAAISGGIVDGGITFADTASTLALSGAPVITANGGGVNLNGNVMTVESALSDGASIYTSNFGFVTGTTVAGNEKYFHSVSASDSFDVDVNLYDGKVFIGKVGCLCAMPEGEHTQGCIVAMTDLGLNAEAGDKLAKLPLTDYEKLTDGFWYLPNGEAAVNTAYPATDAKVVLDLNGVVDEITNGFCLITTQNAENAILIVTDTSAAGTGALKLSSSATTGHQGGILRVSTSTGKTANRAYLLSGTLDATGYQLSDNGGAAISIQRSTFKMYGGKIIGTGYNAPTGGAVRVYAATFEMKGGEITGGNASNGGNVYVETAGTFLMEGGKIYGGVASEGSNVYMLGTMTMSGGEIAGGVYVKSDNASFTGDAKVSKGSLYSLKIADGKVIDVDGLTGKLYVTAQEGVAFAKNAVLDHQEKGIVESELYKSGIQVPVSYQGDMLYMGMPSMVYCVCGVESDNPEDHIDGCDGTKYQWVLWTKDNVLPTESGYYQLAYDVTPVQTTVPAAGATIYLDLHGKDIKLADDQNLYEFTDNDGVTIVITDASEEADGQVILTGTSKTSGGMFDLNKGNNFELYRATLSSKDFTLDDGSNERNGAVAVVRGTFTMHSGTIIGGHTTKGCGGALAVYGKVVVKGGTIRDGSSGNWGGNIGAWGEIVLEGGVITGGSARNGGNIGLQGATLTTSNVVISNGTATPVVVEDTTNGGTTNSGGFGGNIYAFHNGATATLGEGTVIVDGVAMSAGNISLTVGNADAGRKTVTINGAKILGGTAQGLVCEDKNGSAKNAGGIGGNIIVSARIDLVMNSGDITGGKAVTGSAGNVYVESNSKFTMNGGTVGGSVTYEGTEYVGGQGKNNGGSIRINGSNASMLLAGGELINGITADSGGNLMISSGATFTMTDGVIKNGIAKTSNPGHESANVFIQDSKGIISGGTIYGGVAVQNAFNTNNVSKLELSGNVVIDGTLNDTDSTSVALWKYGSCTDPMITITGELTGRVGIYNEDHTFIGVAGEFNKKSLNALFSDQDNQEIFCIDDEFAAAHPHYADGDIDLTENANMLYLGRVKCICGGKLAHDANNEVCDGTTYLWFPTTVWKNGKLASNGDGLKHFFYLTQDDGTSSAAVSRSAVIVKPGTWYCLDLNGYSVHSKSFRMFDTRPASDRGTASSATTDNIRIAFTNTSANASTLGIHGAGHQGRFAWASFNGRRVDMFNINVDVAADASTRYDSTSTTDGVTTSTWNGKVGAVIASAGDNTYVNVQNVNFTNSSEKIGGNGVFLGVQGNSVANVRNSTFTGAKAYQITNFVPEGDSLVTNYEVGGKGAAILVDTTADLYMTDCSFTGNYAELRGGAILALLNSKVTLTNTTITGNTAGENGGAVYLSDSSTLTVAGSTTITGNKVDGAENNVYAEAAASIVLADGFTGSIGLTGAEDAVLVDGLKAGNDKVGTNLLLDDAENNKFEYLDAGLIITDKANVIQCACGGKAVGVGDHECELLVFKPWTSDSTLPASGNYYLTKSVSLKGATKVYKTGNVLNLDLNGQIVKQLNNDRVFTTYDSGGNNTNMVISITDSSKDGTGTLRAASVVGYNQGGIIWFVGSGNTMNLYAGTLDGSPYTVSNVASLKVVGGSGTDKNYLVITDGKWAYANTSTPTAEKNGGAMVIGKGNTFNIYGGTILGGTASNVAKTYIGNDGNTYTIPATYSAQAGTMEVNGTVNMYAGTISGGRAYNNAGSIRISGNGASFTMHNGTVTGGFAGCDNLLTVSTGEYSVKSGQGGNFWVGSTGTLTIKGGTVENGIATNCGGNIHNASGTLEISGNAKLQLGKDIGYTSSGNITNGFTVTYNENNKFFTSNSNVYSVNGTMKLYGGIMDGSVAATNSTDTGVTIYVHGNPQIGTTTEGDKVFGFNLGGYSTTTTTTRTNPSINVDGDIGSECTMKLSVSSAKTAYNFVLVTGLKTEQEAAAFKPINEETHKLTVSQTAGADTYQLTLEEITP